MEKKFPYRRMTVIGATGSGKSTLAERLASKLGLDYIELDALHWEQNWTEASVEVFRSRVEKATQAQAWAVAGNYHVVRDLVWSRAEAVIWLDYAFPVVFWRLTVRIFRRAVTREVLWNDNVETFWPHLKLWSDESLFKWLFKTYWRRKREYPQLLAQPEHRHLKMLHFRAPRETEEWLVALERKEIVQVPSGSSFLW